MRCESEEGLRRSVRSGEAEDEGLRRSVHIEAEDESEEGLRRSERSGLDEGLRRGAAAGVCCGEEEWLHREPASNVGWFRGGAAQRACAGSSEPL